MVTRLVATLVLLGGCWDIDELHHLYRPDGAPSIGDAQAGDTGAPDSDVITDGGMPSDGPAPTDGGGASDLACAAGFVPGDGGCVSRWVEERSGDAFRDVYALSGHVYAVALRLHPSPDPFEWVLHHRDPAGTWSEDTIDTVTSQSQVRVLALATNNLYASVNEVLYHSSGNGTWSPVLTPANEFVTVIVGLGNLAYAGTTGLQGNLGALRSSTGTTFSAVTTPGCSSFYDGFAGNGFVALDAANHNCTTKVVTGYSLLMSTGGAFSDVPLPNAPTLAQAVWGSSPTNLYVGLYQKHVVGHLQGTSWTLEPLPSEGGDDGSLRALGGWDAGNLWGITEKGQVVHFDGTSWKGELPFGTSVGAQGGNDRVALAGPSDVYITLDSRLLHRQ